jgi:hypothetical protein
VKQLRITVNSTLDGRVTDRVRRAVNQAMDPQSCSPLDHEVSPLLTIDKVDELRLGEWWAELDFDTVYRGQAWSFMYL